MENGSIRKKRLKLNTISSFVYQVTNIVCNFILPRLILGAYGSEVNGLVNSIAQFLHVIGFLELGVGSVVQSALYGPLSRKDYESVGKIITSAQRFFRCIAYILSGYVLVLIVVYPLINDQNFGWSYSALLILSISLSSFAQYYFGVVDSLLLAADQRSYVQNITQTSTIVMNTLACALLIQMGAGIHAVKLTTSVFFLLRPVVFRIYISRCYCINRNIKCTEEPIQQKWNGIAQHIAAVVLDGTDIIILTVFSSFSNVSVYSVYHLVLNGIKGLFMSFINGIKALIGELWAKQELDTLNQTFGWFEWALHTGVVFVFGCTGVLLVPFITVYINGVYDAANYIQPLFALLITLAHAGHCLRLPYSVMILAGGHYKQTQNSYIVAAVINIVVSITTVISFGLIGVAIGTLVAMLYQTVWMARYISKNLNRWPFKNFIKQITVNAVTVLIAGFATRLIPLASISYTAWIRMAVQVAMLWIAAILTMNILFYQDYMATLYKLATSKLHRSGKAK